MGRRGTPRHGALRLAALAVFAVLAIERWCSSVALRKNSLNSILFVSSRSSLGLSPPTRGEHGAAAAHALSAATEAAEAPPAEPAAESAAGAAAAAAAATEDPSSKPVSRRYRVPTTPKVYMVCYEHLEEAQRAVDLLAGSYIDGKPIQVTLDDFEECLEEGHFKVNVQGVSPYTDDVEVEKHMEKVGKVTHLKYEKEWKFGQVQFEDSEYAWQARIQLDGTEFMGKIIRTELDCSTDFLNTVLVHGIQRRAMWHDLKDHFKQFGTVRYATIHGGPRSAKVVYEDSEAAATAVKQFNKHKIEGQSKYLYVAFAHDGVGSVLDETTGFDERIRSALRVQNVEKWTSEEQLHELFSGAGKVLSVTKLDPDELVPPEFLAT